MNASCDLSTYKNIIDADGHILEPPDIWGTYIDPKFRDRALRIRMGDDGREYLELDGKPSKFFNIKALTLLGGMGRSAEEIAACMQKTYKEAAPFGSMNPKERLALMDRENMAVALIYPSIGLT